MLIKLLASTNGFLSFQERPLVQLMPAAAHAPGERCGDLRFATVNIPNEPGVQSLAAASSPGSSRTCWACTLTQAALAPVRAVCRRCPWSGCGGGADGLEATSAALIGGCSGLSGLGNPVNAVQNGR